MWICIGLMIAAAILLVFYLLEKCKRFSLKGVLLKTGISLLFIAVATSAMLQKEQHVLNGFIIAGLIFGLLGDIFLDLKFVYPKDDKIYTYSGFAVFGIGHIFFVTGMFLEYYGDTNPLLLLIPILGSITFAGAVVLLAKPLKLDYKDLKIVVIAYALLLAWTPLTALMLSISTLWSVPTLTTIFVGGVLFVISDLVLSGTYFGEGKNRPIDYVLNYLTYYGAQFVIAFSLFFI